MAAVIDRDFLAGLHAVATSTAEALEGRASLARDADQYQAAEVADLAANGFRALAELASTHLAAEERRLLAVIEEEQDGPGEDAARRSLQIFRAAMKGGE